MMNLTENLSSSFEYARAFFSRLFDWIILMILAIIPIVDFIVIGYFAKVLRDGAASKTPPKIEGYGRMFMDGLKTFVAGVIYLIPTLIVTGVLTFAGIMIHLNIFEMVVPIVAIGIATLVFAFMGIINMLKVGAFGKVFAFGEITANIKKIGWPRYIAFLIIYIVMGMVVALIADAFVSFVPVVGTVLGIIIALGLLVLVGTTISRSAGLLYDSAIGVMSTAAPAPPPGKVELEIPPPPPPLA